MTRENAIVEGMEALHIDGHEIAITRPGKILFPGGTSKGDLVRYYQRIGPWMLPHLKGRPLSMERFPNGIEREGFFQKAAASYYPHWIQTVTVAKAGGTVQHVVCNDVATLVYLANQACVTLHPWLSRADRPQFPDQMIFDLDPSGDDFAWVISAARAFKELLDAIELPAYLKTTGSRGLHIVAPLDRTDDYEAVRAFAVELAEAVVAQDPAKYTLEQRKNKRQGRVFIDINRNAYAQTAVAPYSVRPRSDAPVAVPIEWSELADEQFRPDGVTVAMLIERLVSGKDPWPKDPWKDFWRKPAALKKEQAGKVTNNPELEAEGQDEKVAGKIQKKVGQIEKVFEQ